MRRRIRSGVLAALALACAIVLGVGSTAVAPPATAVTALIAPGTGTPDASVVAGYMQNARDYYMTTTPCTIENDCNLIGVNYPATFWPIFFRPRWCVPGRCEKWDVSVADGLNGFNSQLMNLLATTDEEIVLFGYSQGGAIVSDQLRLLADLDPQLRQRLSVVLIGNIDNPLGGPWTLLGFLGHIPILDVTTGMPTIVDTGIPTTSIHFEYDAVGDAPVYWGNLPAVLNGIAGFWYVHGQMLWPNGYNENGLPNGYTPQELADQMNPALHPENFAYDSYGNPFITVPTRTLPIMIPFIDFGKATGLSWLIEPLVDLISPALRVIIDTAYDRTADPGVPRYLSLLPFNPKLDLGVVAADFVAAIGEGIDAFLADLGLKSAPAVSSTSRDGRPDPAPAGVSASTAAAEVAAAQTDGPADQPATPTEVSAPSEVPSQATTQGASARTGRGQSARHPGPVRARADGAQTGSRRAAAHRAVA